MFGADALERKFGPTPPDEWKSMLGRLREFEIDRGIQRLAYSGKRDVPSLPEFVRLARHIGDDIDEGPQPIALPSSDGFTGDGWDIVGNIHLLKYIRSNVPKLTTEQEHKTALLVEQKKLWSKRMREFIDPDTDVVGRPPSAYQKAEWAHCMATAEAGFVPRGATA